MTQRGDVICSSPRSGTNDLCQLLASTGEPGQPQDGSTAPASEPARDADHPLAAPAQLQQVLARGITPNGVYGMKMFCTGFDQLAGLDGVSAVPALHWVSLGRRDASGQAISDVRSTQTQPYRSTATAVAASTLPTLAKDQTMTDDLWNRPAFPLRRTPFAHVCSDDFLPPDLFAELAASFPECPRASGPTGFTIHTGDVEFDDLMRTSTPWREFRAACDSPAFTDFMLRQFSDRFAQAATVDLSHAKHVHYVESRADKESRHLAHPVHPADALWTRFDLMQGRVGYKRAMHVDHRRRAATMLIYFTDPAESGAVGGDLLLHDAEGAATVVSPRANRVVMFPCCNDSWHSVSLIERQSRPRNFLQVTLSSSVDLWPAVRPGMGARLRARLKSIAQIR